MQLTSFDRWLREKFVYETHILTLRPCEKVPKGIKQCELPEKAGRRYKHLYSTGNAKAADLLIHNLKENSQMFTTQIVNKKAWYTKFLAPDGKSPTWWLVSFVFIFISIAAAGFWLNNLLSDPEVRKNLLDSLEILKG